jgi:hypothetical protein
MSGGMLTKLEKREKKIHKKAAHVGSRRRTQSKVSEIFHFDAEKEEESRPEIEH